LTKKDKIYAEIFIFKIKTAMERKFTYSREVIIITIIGLICLFSLSYVVTTNQYDYTTIIGILAIGLLLYPIINAPISIIQTDDNIKLNKLFCRKTYKYKDYDVKEVSNIDLSKSIRVLGSGGYFGYTGFFWEKGHGFFKLVQTTKSHKFLEIKKKQNGHNTYIAL